jgi:hypothetical protein
MRHRPSPAWWAAAAGVRRATMSPRQRLCRVDTCPLLFDLHHAAIALDLVIGEGHSRNDEEARNALLARGEAQEERLKNFAIIRCAIGTAMKQGWDVIQVLSQDFKDPRR